MSRILKIEERGDYHAKTTIPTIRLKGKWLQAAGFDPGSTVQLTVISPGVIEIRVNSPVKIEPEQTRRVMENLDAAIARHDKL